MFISNNKYRDLTGNLQFWGLIAVKGGEKVGRFYVTSQLLYHYKKSPMTHIIIDL